jgi:hypothetical protein
MKLSTLSTSKDLKNFLLDADEMDSASEMPPGDGWEGEAVLRSPEALRPLMHQS